ncbi:MAG: DUF3788 domain-containing protein [Streptococcaceae bacterium]|jgi:hypothetical protein|nr:DUF3788 domain-containing protein [Streptococcaceae bacterium]
MDRVTKSYREVKEMLGVTSSAWERLLGEIRSNYVVDEKWAEGKPTHKHYNNLYVRCASKPLLALSIRDNFFIVGITLGADERNKFDEQRELFSEFILQEYDKAEVLHDGKWLGFEISDECLLDDLLKLVEIKRKPNRKIKPTSLEKCGLLDIGLSKDEITTQILS